MSKSCALFVYARSWIASSGPVIGLAVWVALAPQPSKAIPAFARKYGLKCYSCHTIPPALNKNGYMFKRLGYRLPPDGMDGSKPWPRIAELDAGAKYDLTNALSIVTQGSYSAEKTGGDEPASATSFNLDESALFAAGTVPGTGFSYFAQYELFEDGGSSLEQAQAIFTAGRANNSAFVKAGEMHMQEGEGTRAAMFYNLFAEPASTLAGADPLAFALDQHPVGVNAGWTWASRYFKQVFALSAKVTNGLNADGSEILGASSKNSKDVWLDADYWFGPDGGVTFMTYRGTKDQVRNQGAADEFTYRPVLRRYGVFGNYMFFGKLDILGGYIRSKDDWLEESGGAMTSYIADGYRAETDYYIQNGFALMARYDRLHQAVAGGPPANTEAWGVGGVKALTSLGNVLLRATYNHERDVDPLAGTAATNKSFLLDVRLMW